MNYLLQFLLLFWESPQNLLGALALAAQALAGRVQRIGAEKGRLFVQVPDMAVSLGLFVFWPSAWDPDPSAQVRLRAHEYGHAVQSRLLGPLYLPAVGLPSMARAAYGLLYHRRHGRPWQGYLRGYPESWAERAGRRYGRAEEQRSISARLYTSLADWWPLVTAPQEYREEAERFRELIAGECPAARTLLELGSGGGNVASHLKAHYRLTLTDRSPRMLNVSRRLNPECEHLRADMRSLRLGRLFDAVFIHDAVMYLTSLEDLRRALATAALHCAPGGCLLVVPDFFKETFAPSTDHGGWDGEGRSLRYLEWVTDPDPADTTVTADYAFLLKDRRGRVKVVHDRHICGLFGREQWLQLLREVGFDARIEPAGYDPDHPQLGILVGRRR